MAADYASRQDWQAGTQHFERIAAAQRAEVEEEIGGEGILNFEFWILNGRGRRRREEIGGMKEEAERLKGEVEELAGEVVF